MSGSGSDSGSRPDMSGSGSDSGEQGPYERVLVGTDGSITAGRAVARAVAVARSLRARLLVAYVGDAEAGRTVVEGVVAQYGSSGVAIDTHLLTGDPADALIGLAHAENVGLIIVGNKGMTGAQRFLLGSVPNKISHQARCDVLIAHTTGR
jgi:nucleotide-binding universal stress UspA family protein